MKNKLVAILMVTVFLISILSITVPIIPTSASPNVIHVPTDYSTIQAAVDAANPGDTVFVWNGTYYEQVVINKSLTLEGQGDTTIVKPSSADLTQVFDGLFWYGSPNTKQIAGIIMANVSDGSNVTIKNLKVDESNVTTKPTGANYLTGIFYRETGGTIDTVNIVGTGAWSGSDRAYGIYLSAATNTVSIKITGSTITNYDKNGIEAMGNKLTFNIHDNVLTGRGNVTDEVENGINAGRGSVGTVNRNTISNMVYGPETWWCAGIMFYDLIEYGSGSVASNTITDCQIGVIFKNCNGTAQDNTINGGTVGLIGLSSEPNQGGTWTASFVNNTVSGVKDSPGYENSAIDAQTFNAGASLTVTIQNNTLTGGGSNADGIYINASAGTITATITGNNISGTYLGVRLQNATGAQICNNRIIDFVKGGIVTRGAKNILVEGNIISTTLHDVAPNGIDIGIYTGTNGTVKGNEISGCSWKDFTGDYENSWSGSGILVIESGDSLEILGNIVYECDVGMDIESDSMNITCNEVHNNIYGFVFWNAKPKVNYNNIYSNTQYGVYRTALGDLTGVLDARYNWWGDASGPYHATNPSGLGNAVSDNVNFSPWLFAKKVPPLAHDVAIIKVVPSSIRVVVGTIIHINVTVKNEGTAYESFTVTVSYDGNIIGTQAITDLAPGATKVLMFYWDTTEVEPCRDYTITAVASTVPGETDITDNTKSAVVRIGPSAALIKVEPPTYQAKRLNETFSVNITINDLSVCWRVIGIQFKLNYNDTLLEVVDVIEGPFMKQFGDTLFYWVDDVPPVLVCVVLWPKFDGEENAYWDVFAEGSGTIATIIFRAKYQFQTKLGLEEPPAFCTLELSGIVDIILIDDDDKTVPHTVTHGYYEILPTPLGDVNFDGLVDMKDVTALIRAFGVALSHPRWNPQCDLNNDGIVDLKDITIVLRNYGKTN